MKSNSMDNVLNFANKIFGKSNISKIEKFNISFHKKYKIVVFVPESFTEKISSLMSEAGAGVIGKYSECSFRLSGTGTFKSSGGSKPYTGKRGVLERVEEIRLEMVCSHENLNNAVNSMLKVHPYEEPAYDIYEILSGTKTNNSYAVKIELKNPVSLLKVLSAVNNKIEKSTIPVSLGRIKVKKAIVDFSGNNSHLGQFADINGETLYITKNFNRSINIRLL
jgi:hypothetical protein